MTARSVDVGRCLIRYKPLTQYVLVLMGRHAWCSMTETLVDMIPHQVYRLLNVVFLFAVIML